MEVDNKPKPTTSGQRGIMANPLIVAGVTLVVLTIIYRMYVKAEFDGSFDVANGILSVQYSTGRVGVKTTSPSTEFEVNGTTKTTTLEVTGNSEFNNVEVTGTTELASLEVTGDADLTNLDVSTQLQVPVDSTPVGATQGALQFSTGTNSLQVYKTGDGWVEVGGKIPIAETVTDLIDGSDDPLIVSTFEATFTTTTTVNSEATFNAATAAAAENTRIQLTASFSCASALTIPNKALWIDLNGFTLSVPIQVTASIVCQQAAKNIYFSNGTIQYNASGTTGTSASIISASNCFLYIRNVTILHAEYAVSVTGSGGNRVTFYSSGSTYRMNKARSSNNNTYGPIGLFGMVTNDSYIYLTGCTFDTVPGDTFLNSVTDRYTLRGVVRAANATHLFGSCTITGCTIDPAHRMQAVFYSDFFSATGARGTFRLMLDKNIIGTAGVREQLVILTNAYKPLNCFESIWIIENTYQRIDTNKGVMYVEGTTAGGSTDVYIFNNTVPTQKSVNPISFSATYTRDGAGLVTVTTPTAHNFTQGYDITIPSVPTGPTGGLSTGPFIIQSILSGTQFTIQDSVVGVTSGTVPFFDTYANSLRKLISKDGFVRGPSTITSAYLQKYYV